MDLEMAGAVLAAILSALAIAGTLWRWVIAPVVRFVLEQRDAVNRIEAKVDYHLEPNGGEEHEERRPARAIGLKAERDIAVVKGRQANDLERWRRHDLLHARLGLEEKGDG